MGRLKIYRPETTKAQRDTVRKMLSEYSGLVAEVDQLRNLADHYESYFMGILRGMDEHAEGYQRAVDSTRALVADTLAAAARREREAADIAQLVESLPDGENKDLLKYRYFTTTGRPRTVPELAQAFYLTEKTAILHCNDAISTLAAMLFQNTETT